MRIVRRMTKEILAKTHPAARCAEDYWNVVARNPSRLVPGFVRCVHQHSRRAFEPFTLTRCQARLWKFLGNRNFSRNLGALFRDIKERNGAECRSPHAKPIRIRPPSST